MLKALVFDLMGTCVDWHTGVSECLSRSPDIDLDLAQSIATEWRAAFFAEIHRQFEAKEPPEDIDETHMRTLSQILDVRNLVLDDVLKTEAVSSWHTQTGIGSGWPDSLEGLQRLKTKFFIVVLANGTTRLQLDIVKSSGLPFHTLLSSQLLGLTKPDPRIYTKTLELLGAEPEEAMMVASHAYDLRAASVVGMRTAYIHRATEDPQEDMDRISQENEYFVEGTNGSKNCGLSELARLLGV